MSAQQWVLFGYDTSRLVRYWRQGWREALWGQHTRLRRYLAPAVSVQLPEGGRHTIPGARGATDAVPAYALPADLALVKTLSFPVELALELDAAVAMAVAAGSPFPQEDTRYGWHICHHSAQQIEITLVIVSLRQTGQWLAQRGIADPASVELWYLDQNQNGPSVLIHGYGEGQRESRYRRNVRTLFVRGGIATALLMLLLSLPVLNAHAQLGKLEHWHDQAASGTQVVQQQRTELMKAAERMAELRRLQQARPDPRLTLYRLSAALDDEVWLQQYEQRLSHVKLSGQAPNAAAVLQQLAGQPDYAEVRAPAGFRHDPLSGLESFSLDIRLP